MNDSELLQSFAATGSAQSFAQLLRRHAPMVYAATRRQVPDPSEADDITQAVFLVLMRRAAHLPPRVVLASWLLRTTHLACREARRAHARRRKHEQRAAAMRPDHSNAAELPDVDLAPILDAALARLSESDRAALVLRYLEEKSVEEVSQTLGVSLDSGQKRISRALARLRKRLGVGESALSAPSLASFWAAQGHCAVPDALLHQLTTLTGGAGAAAASTTVAALGKGVLKTMFWLKVKIVAATALTALAVGSTAAVVAQQVLAPAPAVTVPPVAPSATVLNNIKAELIGLTTVRLYLE